MGAVMVGVMAAVLLLAGLGLLAGSGAGAPASVPATVVFAVLAGGLLAASLGVVLARHPIRSALSLVVAMVLLAVMFVTLDAHLIAALQIIVYAGAIMVLFLFVIMLLNLQEEPRFTAGVRHLGIGSALGLLFLGVVARLLVARGGAAPADGPGMAAPVPAGFGDIEAVGERLFTQFLLSFEITGVLLLVATIGAVVLAKRHLA